MDIVCASTLCTHCTLCLICIYIYIYDVYIFNAVDILCNTTAVLVCDD